MLPYVEAPAIRLGALELQPFGALACIGVLAGAAVCAHRAHKLGLPLGKTFNAVWWSVVGGFLSAHVIDLVLYRPDDLERGGWRAVSNFGSGLSSFGGFFGGAAALLLYLHTARLPALRYLDVIVEGLAVGWVFGRLGCAIVHDHPGSTTTFPLAVAFPDEPRHDLGLYELVFTLVILVPALWAVRRRALPPGSQLAVACLLYAPARFALDFLRATDLPGSDPRYGGFTPAQYGSVVLLALGLWLVARPTHQDEAIRRR